MQDVLEKPKSRGLLLLQKYQAAKGIKLPRLSEKEENLFPKELVAETLTAGKFIFNSFFVRKFLTMTEF
jgi:hypothetical protein